MVKSIESNPANMTSRLARWMGRCLLFLGLLLAAGSQWWARPLVDLIGELPGGAWMQTPLAFLPVLFMATGMLIYSRPAGKENKAGAAD